MWQMTTLLALETATAGEALIGKDATAAAAATNTNLFTARSFRAERSVAPRNLAEFTPSRNAM
jgi:hypothetical protein